MQGENRAAGGSAFVEADEGEVVYREAPSFLLTAAGLGEITLDVPPPESEDDTRSHCMSELPTMEPVQLSSAPRRLSACGAYPRCSLGRRQD